MILSKMLRPPGILNKSSKENTIFALDYLNEIKKENIVQLVANCNMDGIVGYVVFYEDKNICTCPSCGHDISNTFSFCPNCGKQLK